MPTSPTVALLRPVPLSCLKWKAGPWVGMAALQAALRERQPDWLTIERRPREQEPRFAPDAIPWFWCWMETPDMRRHAATGRPFIVGPNLYPERCLGQSNCLAVFVHSDHQLHWLERVSKTDLKAKAVYWPYPITPVPEGPLAFEHDVLLYWKKLPRGVNGERLLEQLRSRWPLLTVLRYGKYVRQELYDKSRRSRCCLFWSKWDMGSLAQAETLLAGCPTVGTRHGSAWGLPGVSGEFFEDWNVEAMNRGIERALTLDRESVRRWALEFFGTRRIVDHILTSLVAATSRWEQPV